MNEPDLCRTNDGLFMCSPLRGLNAENTNASRSSDEYMSCLSSLIWAWFYDEHRYFYGSFIFSSKKMRSLKRDVHGLFVLVSPNHICDMYSLGEWNIAFLPEIPNTAVHTLSQNRVCFTPNRFPPSCRNNLHRLSGRRVKSLLKCIK